MLTTTHKKGLVGKHLYSKAAREEGLNEGIRAMFSAGLGGALMKVGFNTLDPFDISKCCRIRLSLVTFFEEITGIMFMLQGWKPTKSAFRHVHPDPSWTGHNGTGIGM